MVKIYSFHILKIISSKLLIKNDYSVLTNTDNLLRDKKFIGLKNKINGLSFFL